MNTPRSTTKLSVVKILITILALVTATYANAATTQDENTGNNSQRNNNIISSDSAALAECYKISDEAKSDKCVASVNALAGQNNSDNCLSKKREAAIAKKEIDDACANSGSGGDTDCYSQAKRCENIIQDSEEPSPMDQLYSAASTYTGSNITPPASKKNQNGCPQFSSEQYLKRRKEITDELKDIKKDIADAKKDSADLEKDTQKDIKDAQKDVQDAQKDQQKSLHDIDDDVRDQVKKTSENQSSLKKALTDNDLNIVKLRGKAMESESDKATKLIQINDSAVQDTCLADYQKKLDAYTATKLRASLSFAEMKSMKNSLLNSYNTCIKGYEQQRVALMQSKSQEQAEIRQQIIAAQSDMDETQHSLDLTQTQLTEIQSAATKKKSEAAQQLQQSMQTAQTSMQTASQNMQKQQQIFTQKQADLQKRMNELNAELNAMGTQPDSDSTMSTKKAAAIIRSRIQTVSRYSSDKTCCSSKNKDPLCSLPSAYDDANEDDSDPAVKKNAK